MKIPTLNLSQHSTTAAPTNKISFILSFMLLIWVKFSWSSTHTYISAARDAFPLWVSYERHENPYSTPDLKLYYSGIHAFRRISSYGEISPWIFWSSMRSVMFYFIELRDGKIVRIFTLYNGGGQWKFTQNDE